MGRGGGGGGRGGGGRGSTTNQIPISAADALSLITSGRATASNRQSITLRDEPIGSGRGRVEIRNRSRRFVAPEGSTSLGDGRYLIANTAANIATVRQQGASIPRGTRATVVFRVRGGVTDQMIQASAQQ